MEDEIARGPVDEDPLELLLATLAGLHKQAGEPSARVLASKIGNRLISHSTVNYSFKRMIKWQKLQLIVKALGGDPETIRPQWEAAASSHPPVAAQRPSPPTPPSTSTQPPIQSGPHQPIDAAPSPEVPVPTDAIPKFDLQQLAGKFAEYLSENPFEYQGRLLTPPPAVEAAQEQPAPTAQASRFVGSNNGQKIPPSRSFGPLSTDLLKMPVDQAISEVMNHRRDLAKLWGWI